MNHGFPMSISPSLPFVTLDPPESMDLDQAFHLERLPGGGFRLRYAIADVAAFVDSGRRGRRRGPSAGRDRLQPRRPRSAVPAGALGGRRIAAARRPAARGGLAGGRRRDGSHGRRRRGTGAGVEPGEARLRRGAGGARRRDAPTTCSRLLPEIGALLQQAEHARGGASLGVPTQEVVARDGGYTLRFRSLLPVEDWNAQLSLLTGRAAAEMMLEAGVGIVRTMPPADEYDVARLRRVAAGLGIDWPADLPYAEMLHTVDPSRSDAEAVFLQEAAVLFRAASYVAFDGQPPPDPMHAALAAATPTARRRCAASATGTRTRCASRCAPGSTCPCGRATRCPPCRSRWRSVPSAATGSSARWSTRSRPPCWRRWSGRNRTGS